MKTYVYKIVVIFALIIQAGCTFSGQPQQNISTATASPINGVVIPTKSNNSTDADISNSSLNLQNSNVSFDNSMVYGGRIAREGEWLYFSLDSIDMQPHNIGLCKMKSNGSAFSVLVNDWSKCFNVGTDYLYYIKSNNGWVGGDIYRIKKDGTEEKKLLEGEYINLMLIGNKLYFTCMNEDNFAYKLYRMNIDGTQKELFIQERCDANFLYSNGFIYTVIPIEKKDGSYDVTLTKISINNPNQKTIIAHNFDTAPAFLGYSSFYKYKNKIFYINDKDNHVYSMNDDGTDRKKLNNINVNTMVISEKGKIYCFSWDLNTTIYSFDLDGKNTKEISTLERLCYLLGIVDDYLYFNEDWGEGDISNIGRISTNGSDLKYLVDFAGK